MRNTHYAYKHGGSTLLRNSQLVNENMSRLYPLFPIPLNFCNIPRGRQISSVSDSSDCELQHDLAHIALTFRSTSRRDQK